MRLDIILAVLALVLAVPCWLTIRSESVEDFIDPNAIPMLFPGFSAAPVMFIEIARRRSEEQIEAQNLTAEQQFEGIAFQRRGDSWFLVRDGKLNGLKMDTALIERDVLEHVLDLRLDRDTLVPRENVDEEFRRANHLTVETGMTIICLGQPRAKNVRPPELAHLILGKTTKRGGAGAASIDGYYVCNPSHPREVVIYEPHSQRWNVSIRPSDWSDKLIHEFLMAEVDTFVISNALGQMGFKLNSAKRWEPIPEQFKAGDQPLDLKIVGRLKNQLVGELFNTFATVRAVEFLRGKVPQDAVGAEVIVEAVLKDGTAYTLHVARQRNADSNSSDAVASNHKFKFRVIDFDVASFRRQDPKDLFHPK